jgi:hypothetical protein
MAAMPAPPSPALLSVVAEVEGHLAEAGWDQPPQLFALVDTEELLRAESWAAYHMGAGAEFSLPANVTSPVLVESPGKLTVGVFHRADGRTLALIANRDHHAATTLIVRNVDAIFGIEGKRWTPATAPVAMDLAAGDGVLFRCSNP